MKSKKQILCKHCGEPVIYYRDGWWHGNIYYLYNKCQHLPFRAEPKE